jgi:hypothetical protein
VADRSVLDYSIAINQLDEKDKTSMVLTGSFRDDIFLYLYFYFFVVTSHWKSISS